MQTPTPARTDRWQVIVTLFEQPDLTHARAVLYRESSTTVEACGDSERGVADDAVPEIGEEVATARALRRLADELLDDATAALAKLDVGRLDVGRLDAGELDVEQGVVGHDAGVLTL